MRVHTPSTYPRHFTLFVSRVDGPCLQRVAYSIGKAYTLVLEQLIASSAYGIVHIYLLVQPPPVVHVGTLSHFL